MNHTFSQKIPRKLAILSFGLSALFVVLARLYTVSCADIVFMYTVVPELLEILVNLLECAIYGIAYGLCIYAAYRDSARLFRRCALIYGGSVLFKYLGNYFMTWITDTHMSASYLLENLLYIFLYTLIELAQAAIILLVILRAMKSYHTFIAKQQRIAQALPDAKITLRTYAFPFSKLISLKNPLQKCAFWAGTTVTIFRIVSRLIYDISFGLPTSLVDALWIVVYYLLDFFVGFAVCLLITFLLISMDQKDSDLSNIS